LLSFAYEIKRPFQQQEDLHFCAIKGLATADEVLTSVLPVFVLVGGGGGHFLGFKLKTANFL
jgi:hypothetical protein